VFKELGKAIVGTALLPAQLVADVLTLGGSINGKREPYTVKACKKIMQNIEDATE